MRRTSPACSRPLTTRTPPEWVIDDLERQLDPIQRELRPIARAARRVELLMTIPGVAELLGLTLATEIGDISRFSSAKKLVGYADLAPTIKQSGQSSRTGRISKAGSKHFALGSRRSSAAGLAAD